MSMGRQRCAATSKSTGEQCKRLAAPGHRVCYWHGAASTGPRTPEGRARSALNALKHGIYAKRLLGDEERLAFDDLMERLRVDFDLEEASTLADAKALAMAHIQFLRAIAAGDAAAAERSSRAQLRHARKLRGEKPKAKPGRLRHRSGPSPAEWATALLEEVRAARASGREYDTTRRVGADRPASTD